MSKPHTHPLLWTGLALCVLLSGCDKFKQWMPGAASAASAPTAPPVISLSASDVLTLTTTPLASGPIISGSLQPQRRADVRAETNGVVLQVYKDNGDAVKAGDVLARIDDAALRDASLAAREATRVAQQSVAQAERLLARQQTLAKEGMISAAALEDAQLKRSSAQGELVSAQARAAQAADLVGKTVVRAPFAGVVSERQVSAGDTATMGKALMKVIDPTTIRFEGQVTADGAASLRVGQPVAFRIAGADGRWFDGHISRMDAMANATTRQVAVTVAFDHPADAPQVAGLFAEGIVNTEGRQVVMLPAPSVVRAGEGAWVWRVAGGKLEKVAVTLGERDARSGDFPLLSGLKAGDVIVRHPGSSLSPGQPVRMASAASTTPAAASQ